MTRKDDAHVPQVKICGLTRVDDARACVALGARGIGCVFYPPSPRHVTDDQAERIGRALASTPCTVVGVFVDEPYETIMARVHRCNLGAVQLHGSEPVELVRKLGTAGVRVIKGLFVNKDPGFDSAAGYPAAAFLAECAGGPLAGGNALNWDWGAAKTLSTRHPLVIAGGLTPENVAEAVLAAAPDAVDVSSGVENGPGKKDMTKVKRFLEAVSRTRISRTVRRIF